MGFPAANIGRYYTSSVTKEKMNTSGNCQLSAYSNSKSKRYLRWLRRRLLNVLFVRLRRLPPRRLDIIFDLKLELRCCGGEFESEDGSIGGSLLNRYAPSIDAGDAFDNRQSHAAAAGLGGKKRFKDIRQYLSEIPLPLSSTLTTTMSFSTPIPISNRPPPGISSRAFRNRFVKICSSSAGSALIGGGTE
jgi:hypothetical protein